MDVQNVANDRVITVCFSVDNNYIIHLAVTIASILANNPKEEFLFYILSEGLSAEYKTKLESLKNLKDFEIGYITASRDDFIECPLNADASHITLSAYFRFKLPSFLPNVKKVLYLDCDIVVNGQLSGFWNTDVGDYYAVGVSDIYSTANMRRLELDKCYINSGVMLINLEKWREGNIEEKLFYYTKNNTAKIVWHDQDVINCVLQDDIKIIEDKWNFQYITPYDPHNTNHPDYYSNPPDDIVIIHFVGYKKPWSVDKLWDKHKIQQKYNGLYWRYFKLTPWKDEYADIRELRKTFAKESLSGKMILKSIKEIVKTFITKIIRITRTEKFARKIWRIIKY